MNRKPRQAPVAARPYRMKLRQAHADRTRAKLVAAARRILMTRGGLEAFSLDTVAKRAGVTRLTVYHQFGSKVGLLEAVYDDVARRGRIVERLSTAFQLPDPLVSLHAIVAAFIGFWNSERLVIRRLRSMAALDPSFKGATDRDEWRLATMDRALRRFPPTRGRTVSDPGQAARVLGMLTSFESFDALVGETGDVESAIATTQRLVQAEVEIALSQP